MWRGRHHLVGLRHETGIVRHIGRQIVWLLSHSGQTSAGLKEQRRDEVRAGLSAQLTGRCYVCRQ